MQMTPRRILRSKPQMRFAAKHSYSEISVCRAENGISSIAWWRGIRSRFFKISAANFRRSRNDQDFAACQKLFRAAVLFEIGQAYERPGHARRGNGGESGLSVVFEEIAVFIFDCLRDMSGLFRGKARCSTFGRISNSSGLFSFNAKVFRRESHPTAESTRSASRGQTFFIVIYSMIRLLPETNQKTTTGVLFVRGRRRLSRIYSFRLFGWRFYRLESRGDTRKNLLTCFQAVIKLIDAEGMRAVFVPHRKIIRRSSTVAWLMSALLRLNCAAAASLRDIAAESFAIHIYEVRSVKYRG